MLLRDNGMGSLTDCLAVLTRFPGKAWQSSLCRKRSNKEMGTKETEKNGLGNFWITDHTKSKKTERPTEALRKCLGEQRRPLVQKLVLWHLSCCQMELVPSPH